MPKQDTNIDVEKYLFFNDLRTWGESGNVKVKSKTSPKLNNKGMDSVFVGHPDKFHHETVKIHHPTTNS